MGKRKALLPPDHHSPVMHPQADSLSDCRILFTSLTPQGFNKDRSYAVEESIVQTGYESTKM
jgi:hypothetical protein